MSEVKPNNLCTKVCTSIGDPVHQESTTLPTSTPLNTLLKTKDIVFLNKEHKWFKRGVKETIFVRRQNPLLSMEGASDITYQKYKTQRLRKSLKGSRSRDNSTLSRIIEPEERSPGLKKKASWMRFDTVV